MQEAIFNYELNRFFQKIDFTCLDYTMYCAFFISCICLIFLLGYFFGKNA
jgi:hypothetical protein